MSEIIYKELLDSFVNKEIATEMFIEKYIEKWKSDRDNGIEYDEKLGRILDRIYTSCDCCGKVPENSFEISEPELRNEVALLRYIWWG